MPTAIESDGTAIDAFSKALLKLVDDYVETDTDAAAAIAALNERIDALERWRERRDTA